MIEKLFLGGILLFFILAFAIKNIITIIRTKQSIKGKSAKVNISVLLSTSIYFLIVLRLTNDNIRWFLEIDAVKSAILNSVGLVVVSIGFILGVSALVSMKNSWRVGIKYDQKTELITSGIYRFSRNPYFLSYDVLILGYILIFPSLLLFSLYVLLAVCFNLMILEEEKYLENLHGNAYLEYKKKVNRYLTLK